MEKRVYEGIAITENNRLIFPVLMYWTKCGMPDKADAEDDEIVRAYQTII